jgi:hypothetical protein
VAILIEINHFGKGFIGLLSHPQPANKVRILHYFVGRVTRDNGHLKEQSQENNNIIYILYII